MWFGESERAGLPISAPLEEDNGTQWPKTTIRWRNTGTSFVLEQWRLENPKGPTRGVWVEVSCVLSPISNQQSSIINLQSPSK
jgi:hypothetical protein